jgi:tetratricopeptide (TPR) repeat protein
VIALGLVALWIAQEQRLLSGFFNDNFLPILPGSHHTRLAYPLISPQHLFDLLNELLLISPIALLSIAAFFRSPRDEDKFNGTTILFLESITLFYVVEYLIFNKVLGAGRDWDVFSPLAIALSLYAAILLLERFRNIPRVLAAFAFMVLVVHNGPWIGINSSKEKSLNRFVNLADNGYWSNYAKAYAYELLAKHSYNNGDRAQAVNYFLAALKTDPKNMRYKHDLAELSLECKRYPEALKYYREILEQQPGSVEAMNGLGILYGTIGQQDSAEAAFSHAIRIDPTFLPPYENLARLYLKTNRIEQAIALLEKCITVAPNSASLHRSVGKLYEKIGDRDRAKVYFEKASALEKGKK